MALPTLLPLTEAAERLGLTEAELRTRVEEGTIAAGKLPDGEIVVSEESVRRHIPKEELPEYKVYQHLAREEIGINEAAKKYQIPFSTLHGWVDKGYIDRIGRAGRKVLINEQDVAYCATVYHQRRGQGKWLFNPDGTPYRPKSRQMLPKAV